MTVLNKTTEYRSWELHMTREENSNNSILGISDSIADNERVLSPPTMEALRKHLPLALSEDNFWLKYSMIRDGTNLRSFYNSTRQSSRTLMAIETVNGEIFGCFVSSPWRSQKSFYGSCEAFLWRMRKNRFTPTNSLEEQLELEADLEIFKWNTNNRNIQYSSDDILAVGGGFPDDAEEQKKQWGFGFALDGELLEGTSSPCITFGDCTHGSPSMNQIFKKGDVFEVRNMEVWTFTPCFDVQKAENLEMGRFFANSNFQ